MRISYLNLWFQNFLTVAPCEKDHVRWSVASSYPISCTVWCFVFTSLPEWVCLGWKSGSVKSLIICLMQPIDAIFKSIFWTWKPIHFQFSVHFGDATSVKTVETLDSVWSIWAVRLLLIKERGCLIFLEDLGRVAICAYFVRSSSVFYPCDSALTCSSMLLKNLRAIRGYHSRGVSLALTLQHFHKLWRTANFNQPAKERRRLLIHHITLVI